MDRSGGGGYRSANVRHPPSERTGAPLGQLSFNLGIEGADQALPDPAGLLTAVGRIGYSFELAVADIVDNSIDAEATHVVIRLLRSAEKLVAVTIDDNGHGMTMARLKDAMSFGRRGTKGDLSLGKFGMGLKSASFSQCDRLTVVSRRAGKVAGRRWTVEGIHAGWMCQRLEPKSAHRFLAEQCREGRPEVNTAVLWDELKGHTVPPVRVEEYITDLALKLRNRLGLLFHRFLDRGDLSIRIETADMESGGAGPSYVVRSFDPFGYPVSGSRGYPKTLTLDLAGMGSLTARAHIWPRKSKHRCYSLGAGGAAQHQGFYFYRNDRLIQAGGWNRMRADAEPHKSLARVCVDLPASFDDFFELNVQKTRVEVPPQFFDALAAASSVNTTFKKFLERAETVYRTKPPPETPTPLVPGKGFTQDFSKRIEKVVSGGEDAERVDLGWKSMGDDRFFEIDPNENTLSINRRFRNAILGGRRGSAGDAPLIKTVLLLLFEEDIRSSRKSKQQATRHELWQRILSEAAWMEVERLE